MTQKISKIIRETLDSSAQTLLKFDEKVAPWDEICHQILKTRGKVAFIGIGKSGLIAQKISATFASTGTPAFFIHPSEAMHGDLGMLQSDDIIFAISYSGESRELAEPLHHARLRGIKIISLSAFLGSTLKNLSDFCIKISANDRIFGAPMESSTLCLSIGDALATALISLRNFTEKDFSKLHPGGTLGRRLFVKISSLMQRTNLPIVSLKTPLKTAIVEMTKGRLGTVILTDEEGNLAGIFSDGDLRRAMSNQNFSLMDFCEKYATLTPKFTTDPEMLAFDALKVMENAKIQLLVVCEKNPKNPALPGKISGALHLHSLIAAGIS